MREPLNGRLGGVFIPVTTNFDAVTGDIAPVPFRDNLRRFVDLPVDGLVLFGSTGEGVLLEDDEKARLMSFAREVVPPGIPLVGGAGAESTRATIRQTKLLADAGADLVLVKPPWYFGPFLTPAALLDHFRAVADASPVPVLVYHMPKYTRVTLEPGLVGELARHANVAGLKDSSGDVKRFADYTSACPQACRLFVGSGALLYTALELGAAGGVVAVGNFAAAMCVDLVREFRAGNTRRAGEIQGPLTDLHREIVGTHGPVGVKAALDLLGWAGGAVRTPLRSLADRERKHVARVMQGAGLL
ncbi:MAG: dihydrodipicolinate synthase family protein [Longimicrobiales bacterium]